MYSIDDIFYAGLYIDKKQNLYISFLYKETSKNRGHYKIRKKNVYDINNINMYGN